MRQENRSPNPLKNLVMAFALATSGCATITTPYLDNSCRVGEDTQTKFLFLQANSTTGRQFSDECAQGNNIGLLAIKGRLQDGTLNPISAFLAESQMKKIENALLAGQDVERNKSIIKFAISSLSQYGITREDLQKTIDAFKKKQEPISSSCFTDSLVYRCK